MATKAKNQKETDPAILTVRLIMPLKTKRAFKSKCALEAIPMKRFFDQRIAEFLGMPKVASR